MATLLKADGTTAEVKPAHGNTFRLAELQAFVGGYIELVPGTEATFCNEDGILHRLPYNRQASMRFGCRLVGDVIVCSPTEAGEDSPDPDPDSAPLRSFRCWFRDGSACLVNATTPEQAKAIAEVLHPDALNHVCKTERL